MKKERIGKRILRCFLAGVLCVAMAAGYIPSSVVKANPGSTERPDTEDLELNKSIKLQDDGTYKITMEAYATGQTTVHQDREGVPLDIVLVLDQSGSMSYDFGEGTQVTGYTQKYGANTKIKNVYNYSITKDLWYKDGDNYYKVTVYPYWSSGHREWRYTMSYNKNGQVTYLRSNVGGDTNIGCTLYEQNLTTVQKKRLDALQDSVNNFIDSVQADGTLNEVNHRIAIAGFSSYSYYNKDKDRTYYYKNTEILTGVGTIPPTDPVSNNAGVSYYPNNKAYNGVQYSPNTGGYNTACGNALQDISTQGGFLNTKAAVSYLTAHGGTQTDHGMAMAKDIMERRAETTYIDRAGNQRDRQKVVILFSDGEPTGSGAAFDKSTADKAVEYAKNLKDNQTKVFSIGIFNGAKNDPVSSGITYNYDGYGNASINNEGYGSDSLVTASNKFMHYVSSNYPNATSTTAAGNRASGSNFYKTAGNPRDLDDVFQSIYTEIGTGSTSVDLDDTAVLKDTISEYFNIAGKNKVTAYTVDGTTTDDENYTWGTTKTSMASSNISLEGKTIKVKGFNYKDNFITKAHPGKKLVVEAIVTADELAAGAGVIPSNVGPTGDSSNPDGTKGDGAGVYAVSTEGGVTTETPAEYFEVPHISIPSNAYVLDFGKSVSIAQSEYTGITSFSGMSQSLSARPSNDAITGSYGKTERGTSGKAFKYTPTTFCWNGIDTVYGLGQLSDQAAEKTERNQDYQWNQTKFVPATSVYYEDDFGTASSNSEVNIVYTGSWSTEGVSKNDEQSYKSSTSTNKDNYGWDEVYRNDSGHSNGSAHVVNGQGSFDKNNSNAKAEFTFTGTGADIYSRTNLTTGQVMAAVYKVNSNGQAEDEAEQVFIVDNLYESGDLYQIPTLALKMDEYGKYKVVITVSTNVTEQTEDARSTYYLDGIRVYNPMDVSGGDAAKYYRDDSELNPLIVEFRDVLLNKENALNAVTSKDVTQGAVFIDKINNSIQLEDALATFQNYGPKNEVYLKKGNMVAFHVNEDKIGENGTKNSKVLVGIKAPEGTATVKVNNTAQIIRTATDMYYVVTPDADGNVVISNDSDNLIALTKIKVTDVTSGLDDSFIESNETLADAIETYAGTKAVETNTLPVEETTKIYSGNVTTTDSKDAKTSSVSNVWSQLKKNVAAFLG